MQQIRDLNPDIIVLTGDFIDASNHTNIQSALLFMQQIVDIAPTYYVYGNHEHYLPKSDLSSFEEKIQEFGVHFMNNETIQIWRMKHRMIFRFCLRMSRSICVIIMRNPAWILCSPAMPTAGNGAFPLRIRDCTDRIRDSFRNILTAFIPKEIRPCI